MIRRCIALALFLSILPVAGRAAENLGVLGAHPRWSVLEKYQETITRDEFTHLVRDVYCTQGMAEDLIRIDTDSARLLIDRADKKYFTLRFARAMYF